MQVSSTRNGVSPTCDRATALYRILNDHQIELEQEGMENWLLRKTIKEEKAIAEAEIEQYQTTRRVTASMRSASAIVGSNVTRLASARRPHHT
jgi:hypothetical protein